MVALPAKMETVLIEDQFPVMTVTLNRPKVANAMSLKMVEELSTLFDHIELQQYRVLVIKGANKIFCAGADIKEFQRIKEMQTLKGDATSLAGYNRLFGKLLEQANRLPLVVVCVLQGAVMGGGFGLASVSDVAIADDSAIFALPETSLGIIPAQIAPFVVNRIGLTATRRLALLGDRLSSKQALNLGLIHSRVEDSSELDANVDKIIAKALRCAPNANAATKNLLLNVGHKSMNDLLDDAAVEFSSAVKGEGKEGAAAFIQKRLPNWAEKK